MLDEGKISQREYEIVKTELVEAPAEEWEQTDLASEVEAGSSDDEPEDAPGWRAAFDQIPTLYRAAGALALLVLVAGVFLSGRSDAAGSVTTDPVSATTSSARAAPGSLGLLLGDLADGWNAVPDPPSINGGVMTSPEPGRFDSFLYRFDTSSILAGAHDPMDGSVYALMIQSSLHNPSISSLYIHLCYLLHPGSQACLDSFIESTGMFGRSHVELAGTEHVSSWDFEGNRWQSEIVDDIETIRVLGEQAP